LTNTKTDNLFFLYLGKLIIMKKILLVLTLTALIFACKKEDDKPNTNTNNNTTVEGCMDTLALNYNPEATENDGSCEYNVVEGCMDTIALNYNSYATVDDGSCEYPPSELKLSIITINSMPMTNNGSNWDIGLFGSENPDVFYVLKQGAGDIISSSSQDNIESFPIFFTESLPYIITNLSEEYTIELYDNDQIGGVGENELIGSCSFIPNEYITNGGDEINITSNGIDMTLDVEWLQ
jgi:hypothetical protein